MRARPESILITALAVFATLGVTALLIDRVGLGAHDARLVDPDPALIEPGVPFARLRTPVAAPTVDPADAWFAAARPFCNPVEVDSRLRMSQPPRTERGTMNAAACFALAGRIDVARAWIDRLPAERRWEAAGAVFAAGHPAADAGDELAAGPLMELVVEYWPNHYMALYHAGAAAFERGDPDAAERHLTRFLEEYAQEDGWRSNAVAMLESMRG
jgi:tetratricopeptide (TPR) repeat protein